MPDRKSLIFLNKTANHRLFPSSVTRLGANISLYRNPETSDHSESL